MPDQIIALSHAYEGKPLIATLFVGPDARARCAAFQAELRDHWHWDAGWSHHLLPELDSDQFPESETAWFILANSFHPDIRPVLRHAAQAGVAALVMTHEATRFPSDIAVLEMADGLDDAGALRALIGGAVRQNWSGIDWADVRAYFVQQPQRLIQRMAVVEAIDPLHLATARALDSLGIHAAHLAHLSCVMAWINAGDDFAMEDYWQVAKVIQDRVDEACLVFVSADPEHALKRGKKVVITAGWD